MSTQVVIVALIVLAFAGGLIVHRRFAAANARGETSDAEGLSITDIAGVIPTMCVLLLAFIMVETFGSWKTARDSATEEATVVVELAHAARFLPADGGAEIVRDLSCYERAVRHVEWETMQDGNASNLPEYWLDHITHEIEDARGDETGVAFSMLPLERELASTRVVRLVQSTSSVPLPMTVLMIASVVLSVFFLAMLTHVSIRKPVQLASLVGAAVLLGSSLMLIEEMDSPYAGLTRIEPNAMEHASGELEEERAEYTSRQQPPCDRRGVPKTDGSFELDTTEI